MNIQDTAARVRAKLVEGKENSATAKRLDKLVGALNPEGQASVADILAALYPGVEKEKALGSLRKFRQTIGNVANDAGVRFSIEVDGENRKPPHQRLLWVECGDSTTATTLDIEQRNQAELRGLGDVIPLQGHDLFDTRPIVHYYTVYAADSADARLYKDLLSRLDAFLAPHQRFRFRRSVEFEIPASGSWRRGIVGETAHCQFGLMMLTYKLLDSGFIKSERQFCTPAVICGSCISVALGAVSPNEDLLSGLPPSAVLFGPNGLSWSKLKTRQEKEIFVGSLGDRIVKQVETAAAVTLEIAQRSDDEAAKEFNAGCFTRPRGAKTRIENSAASNAEVDQAANREDALEFLFSWIEDAAAPPYCALLAEYGMGKTTTCKALTHEITGRRAKGDKLPLPIYFDLRSIGSRALDLNLEQILALLLSDAWKTGAARIAVTGRDIIDHVQKTGALIIWDGLDEVLVHLDTAAGQRFTRQLYSILPPNGPNAEGRSRLLITCRTHYFRTLPEQKNHFLAEERDNVRAENYRAFVLLPFNEEQIREYVKHTLPNEDTSHVIETLDSIHNLRELAERPYTLSLIAREFAHIEQWKAEGRRVTGLTLYRHMVRSWLLRDNGKHHFKPDHKQLLMEYFAARLWQRGERYWSIGHIEEWLMEFLMANPVVAASYAGKGPELLEEDLRTATFLVREGEDKFRFAHTSLQEYFLAGYLRRALVEGKTERWMLSKVSRETLDFLGQWLLEDEGPERTSALQALEELRDRYREKGSVLAFDYFLLAHKKGYPSPSPAGFQLPGADLDDRRMAGSAQAPLNLSGANFRGATLNQTRWTHCNQEDACFDDAVVERAEFVECYLAGSTWNGASLEATLFRRCEVGDADFGDARLLQTYFVPPQAEVPLGEATLALASDDIEGLTCCAWSPDGGRLASASGDGAVRIGDACTGKLLLMLEGHLDSVRSCAWSPDGNSVASASNDHTVRIWDARFGKLLLTLEGHLDSVRSCAWSPDGKRLASASDDHTVRIWDAHAAKLELTLGGHSGSFNDCAWSPDGSRLASASDDHTVRIWDTRAGKLLLTLEGHSSEVLKCAWGPDGKRLASSSNDHTVRIWDTRVGKLLLTLEGHSSGVTGCAWSPDSGRLASTSLDGLALLWDASSGKLMKTLEVHSSGVMSCAWSPDGNRLASASALRDAVRLWDTRTGKLLMVSECHSRVINGCAWSLDGSRLASVEDNTVRLWDARAEKLLLTLEGHSRVVNGCAWSPDGSRLASASWDRTVRLWDARAGKLLLTLEGHSSGVTSCTWDPSGNRLASASFDKTVRLWDVHTGKLLQTLGGHSSMVMSCMWSPDGSRLASASLDGTVRIWGARAGKLLQTLEGHSLSVLRCAWSPDGSRLASASEDETVCIWDAPTGKLLLTMEGHSSSVMDCAWSPDGRHLASASDDRTVRLWDANTGKLLLTLSGHSGRVTGCAWSPDGGRLASSSADGTVRFWDPETGRQLQPTLYHFRHPEAPPSWAVIDHDANRVVACGPDAWRSFGWLTPDPETGLRWLPAEYFGALPEV